MKTFTLSQPVAWDVAYMVRGEFIDEYTFAVEDDYDFQALETAFALNGLDPSEEGLLCLEDEFIDELMAEWEEENRIDDLIADYHASFQK
jgi:hypothetical protein